jgi:pyridoxine 4-dehydrogenase
VAQQSTDMPATAGGTITLGDLTVNRMGYGAMRITGKGVWGPPPDRAEAVRVLRRAVELGVNFIDTADSYGPNVSEEIIAEALHPYPAGLVIATKGGFERPGPDNWQMNGRPDYLRRQLQGSLKRLKQDRIDLWQLHRIDPKVPAAEQFGALAEFVREGLVRHVGLSETGVKEIEAARKVVPIVSVQNRYNVLDREWESVVTHCEREGIAFIPWYPLGGSGKGQAKLAKVEGVAKRLGISTLQLALAWLLARSPAMLVIPGTSKTKHLEENVAAAGVRLDEGTVRELDSK